MMQPVAVIPMHDPDGVMFPHLKTITPSLKRLFAQAFVSITIVTQKKWPEHVAWLEADSFFQVTKHRTGVSVGEDFLTLYKDAAVASAPNQILHLCFIDRVAYALQSEHGAAFMADIQAVQPGDTPLIFQRSTVAWETHPRNYHDLEQMATKVGEWLFAKSLDFAWCHLALQAGQLQKTIPRIVHRDLSMIAEFTLALRNDIKTKDVDWLSWEDPFIYACDAQQLKTEREQSIGETRKRLAYVLPILQLLEAAADR